MLTVLDAINLSAEYLEKKNIESPRINAEHLLSHVLKRKRLELYLSFDRPLSEEEKNEYRELIRRRGTAEPLQYIMGSVEFFGLNIKVSPGVLIPRPETELLVERVIESLKGAGPVRILDIGTGSGNIAIALAKNIENAVITGSDISSEALKVASENSAANDVSDRVILKKLDIINDRLDGMEKFDVIVSNPPYVSLNDFRELRPELNVYEPRIALTDEKDGLSFYRKISERGGELLGGGGRLFFEIGQGQAGEISKVMEGNRFGEIKIFKDYSNIERIITGILR